MKQKADLISHNNNKNCRGLGGWWKEVGEDSGSLNAADGLEILHSLISSPSPSSLNVNHVYHLTSEYTELEGDQYATWQI